MGKPAARVGDFHMCPMVTPGTPPIPHVGGPLLPPGVPTVMIGGMPAATMGNMCVCTGPPDSVVLGSMGVFIGGKPAARMGDSCAHGGAIMVGCPTVLIGEAGGGGGGGFAVVAPTVLLKTMNEMQSSNPEATEKTTNQMAQVIALKEAAENGTPFCEKCEAARGKS